MAILNVSPYSFSAVGRHTTLDAALKYVDTVVQAGATFVDVGGEPTNPGVFPIVSLQQELDCVIPVVEAIAREFAVTISVDTSKAEVMREALKAGMGLINDIRALTEPGALEMAVEADIPVCLMHMTYPHGKKLTPNDPVNENKNSNIVNTVKDFLKQRREVCIAAGIKPENVIVDPGIGHGNFGKNLKQNLQLLKELNAFKDLQSPILIGISRKTFIGQVLNLPIEERLSGSLAATVIAVAKGASIIRTHDARETVEAIKMAVAILHCS